MACDTIKLWHFNTEMAYKDALTQGKIEYTDIAFIKDKTLIITNGAVYYGNSLTTNSNAILAKILAGNLIDITENINSTTGDLESIVINVENHGHLISEIQDLEERLNNAGVLPDGTVNNQVLTWNNTTHTNSWQNIVINNLTSINTDLALSANQGKILKDLVDTKEPSINLALNEEYYFSGDKTWRPLPDALITQSDWNQVDDLAADYIKNKPVIPSIVGLATITYVNTQTANKVDKIAGKALSTNDYTTTDKTIVANQSNINTGDQVADGTTITGIGSIADPFKATQQNINLTLYVPKTTTVNNKALQGNIVLTPNDIGSPAGSGTSTNINTGDQDLSLYVLKETGKGLSQQNYTTSEKNIVALQSNTNTGDETLSSIKTKLGISVLSGQNTGDQVGDNITITGSGRLDSPFVATQQVADQVTITGVGTDLDPFIAVQDIFDNTTITGTGTALDPYKSHALQVSDQVTITGTGAVLNPFVATQQVGDGTTLDGIGTIADPFSVIYSPSAGNADTLDGIDSSGFMPNATVSTGEKVVTRTSNTVEVTLDVLEQYLTGAVSDFTTLAEINAISAYANAAIGQRFWSPTALYEKQNNINWRKILAENIPAT